MHTIIGLLQGTKFYELYKISSQSFISKFKQTSFLPPCLPTHNPPLNPSFPSATTVQPLSGECWGLQRARPPCQPTHFISSCQSRELTQASTLEALLLKRKINSAIESIGHINTSTVSNFSHEIHNTQNSLQRGTAHSHPEKTGQGLDQSWQVLCLRYKNLSS